MLDLVVYGFPRSTFVNIVRMVLTTKKCPTSFVTWSHAASSVAAS